MPFLPPSSSLCTLSPPTLPPDSSAHHTRECQKTNFHTNSRSTHGMHATVMSFTVHIYLFFAHVLAGLSRGQRILQSFYILNLSLGVTHMNRQKTFNSMFPNCFYFRKYICFCFLNLCSYEYLKVYPHVPLHVSFSLFHTTHSYLTVCICTNLYSAINLKYGNLHSSSVSTEQ